MTNKIIFILGFVSVFAFAACKASAQPNEVSNAEKIDGILGFFRDHIIALAPANSDDLAGRRYSGKILEIYPLLFNDLPPPASFSTDQLIETIENRFELNGVKESIDELYSKYPSRITEWDSRYTKKDIRLAFYLFELTFQLVLASEREKHLSSPENSQLFTKIYALYSVILQHALSVYSYNIGRSYGQETSLGRLMYDQLHGRRVYAHIQGLSPESWKRAVREIKSLLIDAKKRGHKRWVADNWRLVGVHAAVAFWPLVFFVLPFPPFPPLPVDIFLNLLWTPLFLKFELIPLYKEWFDEQRASFNTSTGEVAVNGRVRRRLLGTINGCQRILERAGGCSDGKCS